MDNKVGLFLSFLGFIALFITLLGDGAGVGKSFLILFFFFIIILGIFLGTPLGDYFKERMEG